MFNVEDLILVEDPTRNEKRELTISLTNEQCKYIVNILRDASEREWDGFHYRTMQALATQLELAIAPPKHDWRDDLSCPIVGRK